MAYTSGSQGAETNCAAVFMTTLDTLLIAGGFIFVEQVLNGAVTTRVYKSPAASNFFGQDWYFSVTRSTDAATEVTYRVFEQYNSTTHLCFNYAPSANSQIPTAQFAVNDAVGKAPDSTTLGALGSAGSISAAGFNWFVSITPDRLIVATRVSTSDHAYYVGLYSDRDFLPLAVSPFPLVVFPLHTSSGGFCTREPGQTSSASGNFRVTGAYPNWTPYSAGGGANVYTGKGALSKVLIVSERGPGGNSHRGLLVDVWVTQAAKGSNGDTLAATIGGADKTLTQMRNGSATTVFFVDQAV